MRLRLPPRKKFWEWFTRYAPQEIVASASTLLATYYLKPFFEHDSQLLSNIGASYLITAIDALVYAVYALIREWMRHGRTPIGFIERCGLTLRDIVAEYTVSYYVDTAFTRPFCILLMTRTVSNRFIGVFVGETVASVLFYAMTIPCYELRKKFFGSSVPSLDPTMAPLGQKER